MPGKSLPKSKKREMRKARGEDPRGPQANKKVAAASVGEDSLSPSKEKLEQDAKRNKRTTIIVVSILLIIALVVATILIVGAYAAKNIGDDIVGGATHPNQESPQSSLPVNHLTVALAGNFFL